MHDSAKPPGVLSSVAFLSLGVAAIFCGADAIVSESATTPSMHGEGMRVRGVDAVLLGIGWVTMGVGFMSKVIASPLGFLGRRVIPIGLIVIGALFWAFVFI